MNCQNFQSANTKFFKCMQKIIFYVLWGKRRKGRECKEISWEKNSMYTPTGYEDEQIQEETLNFRVIKTSFRGWLWILYYMSPHSPWVMSIQWNHSSNLKKREKITTCFTMKQTTRILYLLLIWNFLLRGMLRWLNWNMAREILCKCSTDMWSNKTLPLCF